MIGNKVVKVVNNGAERAFTFTNTIHNSGSHHILTSPMIIQEHAEVFIDIPLSSQGLGINYFTVHVDGETATVDYINQ